MSCPRSHSMWETQVLLEHLNGLTVCVWEAQDARVLESPEERIYIKCLLVCFCPENENKRENLKISR